MLGLCKQCDSSFKTHKYLAELGKGKYCSRKCYELSKRKQDATERQCARCKEKKPLAAFTKRKRKGPGLCDPYCKQCRNEVGMARKKTAHCRWLDAKRQAIKDHGDEWWAIPEEDYVVLLKENCHYCKGELNPCGVGLDRKDNNLGYTKVNVVPCCKQCNVVKNRFFTYDEMMQLAPVLEQIRKARRP